MVFACYVSFFVVSVFTWCLWFLLVLLLALPTVSLVYREVVLNKDCSNYYNCESRPVSFWLFLGTEAIAFASLFVVFLWFFEGEVPISSPWGLALSGSVCLLVSSVWATFWHNEVWRDLEGDVIFEAVSGDLYGFSCFPDLNEIVSGEPDLLSMRVSGYDKGCFLYPEVTDGLVFKEHLFYLAGTVIFGLFFIRLQLLEFSGCSASMGDSAAYSSFYCVVGLHFLHVCLGVSGLTLYPFFFGSSGSYYYSSILAWYWHFVDYIWLWVYLVFYFL